MTSKPTKRYRQVLNKIQAEEIYRYKLSLIKSSDMEPDIQSSEEKLKGKSVDVSYRFGVSPKTVRDIWTRRTWTESTCHLWYLEDVAQPQNEPSMVRFECRTEHWIRNASIQTNPTLCVIKLPLRIAKTIWVVDEERTLLILNTLHCRYLSSLDRTLQTKQSSKGCYS